jgi:hypothetical protein
MYLFNTAPCEITTIITPATPSRATKMHSFHLPADIIPLIALQIRYPKSFTAFARVSKKFAQVCREISDLKKMEFTIYSKETDEPFSKSYRLTSTLPNGEKHGYTINKSSTINKKLNSFTNYSNDDRISDIAYSYFKNSYKQLLVKNCNKSDSLYQLDRVNLFKTCSPKLWVHTLIYIQKGNSYISVNPDVVDIYVSCIDMGKTKMITIDNRNNQRIVNIRSHHGCVCNYDKGCCYRIIY